MDGLIHGQTDKWMDEWTYGRMDGHVYKQINRGMDG